MKVHGPCKQCGGEIHSYVGGREYCLDCAPAKIDHHRIRKFGVDRFMWDAMYFEQDGACAMAHCENEALVVDHDHTTGKVRALLCRKCNTGLHYIENQEFVRSSLKYLWGDVASAKEVRTEVNSAHRAEGFAA